MCVSAFSCAILLDCELHEDGGLCLFWSQLYVGPWKTTQCIVGACSVTQLCLTLCDPMDCGLTGSSVCGISRARILEWVAISFSRGSSQSRDQTQVS